MSTHSLNEVIDAARETSLELLRRLKADEPAPASLLERRAEALAALAERLPAEGGSLGDTALRELLELDAAIAATASLWRARLADESARLRARGPLRCFGGPHRPAPPSLDLTA